MHLSVEAGVPALTVFLQGLFSFFSPCVLPLIPLYMGYLAGGAQETDEDGNPCYPRKKVLCNTLFFVLGISFAFLTLGLGFSALGRFFGGNRMLLARIGGVLMILFGCYQLGFFGKSTLMEKEHRLPIRVDRLAMNPLTAALLGFGFSFAWTPCVGPALASVLMMVSTAGTARAGLLLMGVYIAGFVLPFLAVGLFTGSVLSFFRNHRGVIRYTTRIGGALLILMGVMTLTGWMNGLTGYLSSENQSTEVSDGKDSQGAGVPNVSGDQGADAQDAEGEGEQQAVPAPDFTLTDQFGNEHTLSDYQGKTIFLNFWATWCGPCRQEMPDIQKLYEDYGRNEGDLVVLGVANPKTEEQPYNSDVSQEEIAAFLKEEGYDYPVVMDLTGEVFAAYGIRAFPTTFMIDDRGNVYGYVTGTLTVDIMENIVKQTMEGQEEQEDVAD